MQTWDKFFNEVIKERHNGYDTTKDKHPTDLDHTKVTPRFPPLLFPLFALLYLLKQS